MTAQRAKPKKQPAKVKVRRPAKGSKSEAILTLTTTTPATPPEIARAVNCTKQHVHQVLDRYGIEHNTLETFKKTRADIYAAASLRILAAVDDDKIKDASLNNMAYALTQLNNAERLERDLSTVIVGYDADSFADRVATLRAAIREADIVDAEETSSNNDMPNSGQAERSTTKLLE